MSESEGTANDLKPEVEVPENRISTEYAYILGGVRNTATFFDFNGVRIIESGITTSDGKYEETFDEITAIIISAPTLDNLGSTTAFCEKDSRLPVLSHTGTLNKIVKCRSGAMFKKIQEKALKSIFEMPVFNPDYKPYTIFQSGNKGTLSLYVLAGTRQEGEMIAKALASEKEEEVNKCAAEYGGVAVLLWRPNLANKPVVRVLLSGTCSSLRIQSSLSKASIFLPFLNAPTVTTSDDLKQTPVPTGARVVRNPSAARPTRPAAATAPRQPSTSKASKPPVDTSATSKSSTDPVEEEKPSVSLKRPAPWDASTSEAAVKAAPTNAGASTSQSPSTQGTPVVERAAQPMDQKQSVAAKRPKMKPPVPVFKKTTTSVPPTKEEEPEPEPAGSPQPSTSTIKKVITTKLDDSTLELQDQSSITSHDSADTSECEISQPIGEPTAPVSLGVISGVVEPEPSLDSNNASTPVTAETGPTNVSAPEGKTQQEMEQLARAEISYFANTIAKKITDQAIVEGMAEETEKVEEPNPKPAGTSQAKVTPTKLDDSTLKSPDQSSTTTILTVDSAAASVPEISQPIRDKIAPVSSLMIPGAVGGPEPSLDSNIAPEPVTADLAVPEGKTEQEKQQLAVAEINYFANTIAKKIIDQAIIDGVEAILRNKTIDEEKKELSEHVQMFTHDFTSILVRQAARDASKKLDEEKLTYGLNKFKLDEKTNEMIQNLVKNAVEGALDSFSPSAQKSTLSPEDNEKIDAIANKIMRDAMEEILNKPSTSIQQPRAVIDNVFDAFDHGDATSTSSSDFEPPVLRMQTNRRPPAVHKPIKFTRPYYFDLVKIPRGMNSMVAENIQEFVSKIRSKYLVLSTDNITESQLQAVIDGHRSGQPCTIIPTHTSDILTEFLEKHQSQLSDIHLSFETPLNEREAGDIIGFDKRKINFD